MPPPDWRALLGFAFERLRDARTYAWYFAASVALAIITTAATRLGGLWPLASLVASLLNIYCALLLARQLMTGRLERWAGDAHRVFRIVTVSFVLAPAAILLAVLLLAVRDSPVAPALLAAGGAILIALTARIAFYVPGLAVGDPMTLRRAYADGRSYWGRLAAVFAALAAPSWAASWLLTQGGLPWIASATLDGVIGALTGFLALSAVSYLYWRHVRT
jgi:hypothetical protein